MDEEPWYSPSSAEEPEYVGETHVRLLSETAIKTQIKFSDDDDWQPPSSLLFNTVTLRVNATGGYLLPELGAGAATEDGVIVSLLAATRRHLQSWE